MVILSGFVRSCALWYLLILKKSHKYTNITQESTYNNKTYIKKQPYFSFDFLYIRESDLAYFTHTYNVEHLFYTFSS